MAEEMTMVEGTFSILAIQTNELVPPRAVWNMSHTEPTRARDMNRKSYADPLTSINSELATSHRPSTTSSNRWRPRRPPPALADEPDKPPSVLEARLNRESAERQRALELIRRKKRETQGSETPSTVRGGGYGDMYNKADVEEAHKHRDRGGGRRRW
jgi:hypothetical protein